VHELLPETTIDNHTPLDEQVELDGRHHVIHLLSSLEDNKRELLLMAYYKGYSQRDIAKTLKIPLGTVKTRMRHAMLQLRELLHQYPNYECIAELV
jgi:RNA polymerase sigma factor (sigma-70 family)